MICISYMCTHVLRGIDTVHVPGFTGTCREKYLKQKRNKGIDGIHKAHIFKAHIFKKHTSSKETHLRNTSSKHKSSKTSFSPTKQKSCLQQHYKSECRIYMYVHIHTYRTLYVYYILLYMCVHDKLYSCINLKYILHVYNVQYHAF